jgi:hypothetical protein
MPPSSTYDKLEGMPDDAVRPEQARKHVGKVLAGAVFIQRVTARVREGDDGESAAIPAGPGSDIIEQLGEVFLDTLVEREIDCVLVGAMAMLMYVSGRNTQDLDFIASRREVRRLPEVIEAYKNDEKNFREGYFGSLKVDFLLTGNRLFKRIAERYSQPMVIGNRTLKVATPEGLVIMKLYAIPTLLYQFREDKILRYEADLADLLAGTEVRDTVVLDELKKHLKPGEFLAAKTVLQDIRERIAQIRKRLQQFPRE